MSGVYQRNHDKVLENFLNTNQDLKNYNKEKYILAKNKLGFIIPLTLVIKPMNMGMSGYNFIGTFKIDKIYKNYCFILLDNDGQIEGFSSSCITVLK